MPSSQHVIFDLLVYTASYKSEPARSSTSPRPHVPRKDHGDVEYPGGSPAPHSRRSRPGGSCRWARLCIRRCDAQAERRDGGARRAMTMERAVRSRRWRVPAGGTAIMTAPASFAAPFSRRRARSPARPRPRPARRGVAGQDCRALPLQEASATALLPRTGAPARGASVNRGWSYRRFRGSGWPCRRRRPGSGRQ